ncbi:hypothetical protein ACTM45_21875 [Citrobacter freundii]|uniref:hypothetical protein n=1 Tax=Citrobacter freundii TaxID=546 RepID=UPI0028BE3465|nr:hypothetical protein [Citrobacter freundii]MDT7101175.1 hypothetical protein [Citrobacter freundii]MEA8884688.1 hypothetical protein [Citrobacter freundii]
MAIVFIPALVVLLEAKEKDFGRELTREDVESIRDDATAMEGANKQVISSQADSLIKISRIWADFFPANTSNQPI